MIQYKTFFSEIFDHNLLETDNDGSVIIYCDMDGVLVDFDKGFKAISGGVSASEIERQSGEMSMFKLINGQENNGIDWWSKLPKKIDCDKLWSFVNSQNAIVKILSSTGSRKSKSNSADIGKRMWLSENLTPSVSDTNIILVDSASVKKIYAKGKHHILIDDISKNIEGWNDQGGTGILHTSAADTISKLQNILSVQQESYGYGWSNV